MRVEVVHFSICAFVLPAGGLSSVNVSLRKICVFNNGGRNVNFLNEHRHCIS